MDDLAARRRRSPLPPFLPLSRLPSLCRSVRSSVSPLVCSLVLLCANRPIIQCSLDKTVRLAISPSSAEKRCLNCGHVVAIFEMKIAALFWPGDWEGDSREMFSCKRLIYLSMLRAGSNNFIHPFSFSFANIRACTMVWCSRGV